MFIVRISSLSLAVRRGELILASLLRPVALPNGLEFFVVFWSVNISLLRSENSKTFEVKELEKKIIFRPAPSHARRDRARANLC